MAKHNFKDETNNKYGRLTVLRLSDMHECKGAIWLCRCDCGNYSNVTGSRLTGGYTQSCGCLAAETTIAIFRKDMVGQRFGRLTVLEYSHARGGPAYWKCSCDCGTEKIISGADLRRGSTRSCGCLAAENRGPNHRRYNPNREEVKRNKKIRSSMRDFVRRALNGRLKTKRSNELLGYTPKQLIKHLESKFTDGMLWDNYGIKPDCWSIDHVKPISAFINEGIEDPKIINALSNLQPMWHLENCSKGAKYKEGGE